jgi:hypothetical protein
MISMTKNLLEAEEVLDRVEDAAVRAAVLMAPEDTVFVLNAERKSSIKGARNAQI